MPSSQRGAPGNGLNDRVQRRPATTGKAASTAKLGLKARPSLSSITNRNEESRDATDEVSHPPASGSGIRASAAASKRSTSPTKASIGRRSVLGSTVNAEKKAVADRPSTASPSKTPAKSTSHNARLSTSNSHRSTRPINYSPQSIGRSGPSNKNKRLSAISASPTSVQQDASVPASVQPPNRAMTRNSRPALGARKSTMSVTVEQRLREMSIVSTMLRAAMADDGSGDDEIKEEYDNQVDEDLAMLKEKLIKARRSEGKEPLDTENDMDLPESIEEAGSVVEATGLETKLVASEERTTELENELNAIRAKLEKAMCLDESIKDDREDEIVGCDRKLDELFARHQEELETANTRADEAEKLTKELKRESVTEFQEFRKLTEAEATAKVNRLLKNQLRGHKAEVDSLTAKLASERALGLEAASKAQNLAYASVDLKNSIDDLQEKHSQLLDKETYRDATFQEVIKSKDLQIQQTRQSLEESLKHAADCKEKLHAAADREHSFNREIHDRMLKIEQIKSAADDRVSQVDKKMASCIQKINELEGQVAHASDLRQQLYRDNIQEVSQMQAVIEALQDRIQQIHEAKETELESQRLHLTQEHDDRMLKARETHEKEVQSEKENSREQLENLNVSRDLAISELEDLRNDYESVIDNLHQRLQETEGMLEQSRPMLQEAQELLNLSRERCSKAESKLQAAVDEDEEKAYIITAKDIELAEFYRQMDTERAGLVAAKKIVAAINIELETVAIAHDEAISAGSSASQPLTDSAPPSPSSYSTNPFIDQIMNQIKTHNPQASPERINAIAANLQIKYYMGQNEELEASNEELGSILQSDLKKLGARCRDLTSRFKSTEISAIKNTDTGNAKMDLLQEKVRRLRGEKALLLQKLTEAHEDAKYQEERLETLTGGSNIRYVTFTKAAQAEMREGRLQFDDDEFDQPRFEHIEYADPANPDHVDHVTGMHEQLQAIHNTHEDLTGMQEQPRAIQNTKKHSMVEPTEHMGPSIMGNVAGMQEQLRAIQDSHENLIGDSQRLAQKMSIVYMPEQLQNLDARTSEGEGEEDEAEHEAEAEAEAQEL